MIYNEYKGLSLSALGMGNMRLPVIDGDDSRIDVETSREMIAYCMNAGINYYDTAYGYHGGQSELVVGELLKDYDRESFYLASKFPGYDLGNMPKVEGIFEEQLKKCQVEYFDFYMFHNVCEMNVESYLNPEYGIFDYLMEQKRNGRIRHLGFSTHGDIECIAKFLEAYGKDMEFCQIELNYFDYQFQNAKGKLELLDKWNIPVWVMEPVRGGQLASLSEDATAKLKAARPDEDVPAWAFRFLQSFPSVTMTLSGMSNMDQLKANINTYEENKPLDDEEMKLILDIADDMIRKTTVPCTACHYCVSKCPMGLDIPFLLKLYNEAMVSGSGAFIAPMALSSVDADKQPQSCIECHACEQVCPQTIHIPEELKKFAEKMGN
ncbi:MAG: aldo/keto reductase [Clostridiales bacterium]|nr:aldo/keto reductase [Candidatus Crickella merdequi]